MLLLTILLCTLNILDYMHHVLDATSVYLGYTADEYLMVSTYLMGMTGYQSH